MIVEGGRAETEGARFHAAAEDVHHLVQLFRIRLPGRALVLHHAAADGRVGRIDGDVGIYTLASKEIHAHDGLAHVRGGRRDAEATVTQHDRGHPQGWRRRCGGIPRELGIVVCVHVDDAGREHETTPVDLF